MFCARVAKVLVVLSVLCACAGREDTGGPQLPAVELRPATVGLDYEVPLAASGGVAPLRYMVGSVPPGLSFDLATGRLTGSAAAEGTYSFTVKVTDANGTTDSRTYSLQTVAAPEGTGFLLKVGNWNIEWFGDTANGPADEPLQQNNVRTVLADINADLWGLEEVVDVNQFNRLKAELPGYEGFVSNDARVTSGQAYYSSGEQKVAVLYKQGVVSVQSARVILMGNDFDFAGRPPLRVDLRITRGGNSVDLVAIVLHMKAQTSSGSADYDRRKAAGAALKTYLDTELPDSRVIILGDWNDDTDVSTSRGGTSSYLPTPYQNFMDAPAQYTFITHPLTLANVASTVSFPSFIDHQLVTNELAASYVSNSAMVVRPSIPSYGTTTTDHYPVVSRFDFTRP